MRCPKCHYISFESGERCRNCGYDFSLSTEAETLDLPIQTGDELTGPLTDLRLGDVDVTASSPSAAPQVSGFEPAPAPRAADDQAAPRRSFAASAFDLPLFSGATADDDRPLVAPPAVPRPPLAVRRGSPAIARPRARALEPEEPVLALDPPEEEPRPRRNVEPKRAPARQETAVEAASIYTTASLIRRSFAAAVDAAIILGIDAAIVYFTLQLCGLGVHEIMLLPVVPFLAFVLLLNGGYFASFVAAGGQTIGKMAAGIRVVPQPPDDGQRVPFGYAVVRAAAYLVSVLPAGVGLLPALFSADRRTLHDRLAETRVVRS